MDNPEDIIRLIKDYPRFKPMYEEMYQLCLNTEKIMGLFSKELQILDENTTQYMMDEMQNTINEKQSVIDAMKKQMQEQLGEKDAAIRVLQKRIEELEMKQK